MNSNLYIEQRVANEQKSQIIAYLLWAFLNMTGVHRMYLGRWASGIIMLLLFAFGTLTAPILIGFIPLAVVAVWWFIDLFLIHKMIRDDSDELRRQLSGTPIGY